MISFCAITVFSVDSCDIFCCLVNLSLILCCSAVGRNVSDFSLNCFNSCLVSICHCILKNFISVNCIVILSVVNLLILVFKCAVFICKLFNFSLKCCCSCINLILLGCNEVISYLIILKKIFDFCLCFSCKCFICKKCFKSCLCIVIFCVGCSYCRLCLSCSANFTSVGVVAVFPCSVVFNRTGKNAFAPCVVAVCTFSVLSGDSCDIFCCLVNLSLILCCSTVFGDCFNLSLDCFNSSLVFIRYYTFNSNGFISVNCFVIISVVNLLEFILKLAVFIIE